MRRFAVALGLGCLFLFSSARAWGWNEFGHMAVAKLAYDQMDDKLKLAIPKLLKAHPHYEEYLAKSCPDGVPVQEWAFLRASIWPDWVRPRKNDPRGTRVTKYHRSSDHYVDVPFVLPADMDLFKGLQTDPDKQDIIGAFKQRMSELALKQTSDEDKAIALCWLLHLVGDVHQPLHCGTLFSSTFRQGDLGGNRFAVKIGGRVYKLHAFWDNALGEVGGSDDDPAERQSRLYKQLKATVDELRAPPYSREKLTELTENPTFPSWVWESHELATKVAYRDGKLKGTVVEFDQPLPATAPEADSEYESTVRELARKRVALAGHRVADKLRKLKDVFVKE